MKSIAVLTVSWVIVSCAVLVSTSLNAEAYSKIWGETVLECHEEDDIIAFAEETPDQEKGIYEYKLLEFWRVPDGNNVSYDVQKFQQLIFNRRPKKIVSKIPGSGKVIVCFKLPKETRDKEWEERVQHLAEELTGQRTPATPKLRVDYLRPNRFRTAAKLHYVYGGRVEYLLGKKPNRYVRRISTTELKAILAGPAE